MLVRLLSRYAGPAAVAEPGARLELPDAEAAAMVAGGYAVSLEPERAVSPPRETRGRGKRER